MRPQSHPKEKMTTPTHIKNRLEYLRLELEAERLSYGELAELQDLAQHIEAGDLRLLEAAGVPEGPGEEYGPWAEGWKNGAILPVW